MTKSGCVLLLIAMQVSIFFNNVDAYKGLACEGGQLPLSCPADTYINVTMAMYGREDNNITCPHATAMKNTSCSSNVTLATVQALCNGHVYCNVDALSYYYGDPCNATYKYLRLEYSCMPCINKHGDDAVCEMWALQGKCTGPEQAWMYANCSKACFKCESFIEPVCTNVLEDTNCTKRASSGECKTNPAVMGAYCKKACAECEQTTSCVNKANETDCEAWHKTSQCTQNSNYMLPNCRKSCFNCTDNVKCENRDKMCDNWALQGACMDNPGYMMAFCSKSCLGCTRDPVCIDSYSQCEGWANRGECSASPVWMYKNCWKSCTQCSSAAVCANTLSDARCEVWAANGECALNYEFMFSNCRLACTRCKALPYGRPKCVNALLNDTLCTAWASQGECTNNAPFMFENCYEACTGCYNPYSIGSGAMPGKVHKDTAAHSIVLPFAFSNTSVITQFVGFFPNTTDVHLQVWRPNGTDVFYLVFDQLFTPSAANQVETIVMEWCIVVQAGDQIGFTSFSDPAPIGFNMAENSYYYPIWLRSAAATDDKFTEITVPFVYSLKADFFFGSKCN